MAPVGFETAISAGERPQTYALDRPFIVNTNLFYDGNDTNSYQNEAAQHRTLQFQEVLF